MTLARRFTPGTGTVMLAMGILSIAALAAPLQAGGDPAQIHQGFSTDPHWEGARNRLPATHPPRVMQRFGYCRTNHAGKASGEMGGYIQSTTRPAYYARRIETRTFKSRLSFSGSFALMEGRSISGWHTLSEVNIGFFNSTEQGWRPKNFLGFRLMGYNEPDGVLVEFGYGTSTGAASAHLLNKAGSEMHTGLMKDVDRARVLRIVPDGARHRWTYTYDPAAQEGRGEIVMTLDGQSWSLPLRREHKAAVLPGDGAVLNRFGIFNQQIPGRAMVVYFDDLKFNGEKEDFTRDPNWEAKGNHVIFEDPVLYGTNDFGYSPTSFTGGEPGEIGGRLWRVDATEPHLKGHYGDDVGKLTLDDRLEAKGKIVFRRFCIDSGMHIGFFNSAGQGWMPKNFVGVYLDSYTPVGRALMPMVGTSTGGEALAFEQSPFFVDDGKVHDWSLLYDPKANGGKGAVTVTLDDQSATLNLKPGERQQGALMNRFGIFNMQDNNGKYCEVYLDDLTYSSRKVETAGTDNQEHLPRGLTRDTTVRTWPTPGMVWTSP